MLVGTANTVFYWSLIYTLAVAPSCKAHISKVQQMHLLLKSSFISESQQMHCSPHTTVKVVLLSLLRGKKTQLFSM